MMYTVPLVEVICLSPQLIDRHSLTKNCQIANFVGTPVYYIRIIIHVRVCIHVRTIVYIYI